MAPRPGWWHHLQASKEEVRLAVDLYNRSGNQRQLEAFIIHMSLGWLKLLQAHVERTGALRLVREFDGERATLAEAAFACEFETPLPIRVQMAGDRIAARVGDVSLEARDAALKTGGVGLIAAQGACSCAEIRIRGN